MNIYLKVVMTLVYLSTIYGIICPTLISMDADVPVIAGVALVFLAPIPIWYTFRNLIKKGVGK